MGFGLVELKILYDIIVEFAAENGQSADDGEAVKKFISDIENHHYHLRNKLYDLKNQQSIILTFNAAASSLGQASMNFLRKKGITPDDVENMIKEMKGYTPSTTPTVDSELGLKQVEARMPDRLSGDTFPHPPRIRHKKRSDPLLRTSPGTDTMEYKEGEVEVSLVSPPGSPNVFILQYSTARTAMQEDEDNKSSSRDSSSSHQGHRIRKTTEQSVEDADFSEEEIG